MNDAALSKLIKRLRDKAAQGGLIPIHDVTLEAAANELELYRAMEESPPQNKRQALEMFRLSHAWLKQHAPHKLIEELNRGAKK